MFTQHTIPTANSANNIEQHRSYANLSKSHGESGSVLSSSAVEQQVDEGSNKDGQSVGIPNHGDAMYVDSSFSSSLSGGSLSAGDVDLQGRIDQLKLSLDNMLAEVNLITGSLLVEQSDEARLNAVSRVAQLNQSIRSIIEIRDCLSTSLAATNKLCTSSAFVSSSSQPTVPSLSVVVPPNLPYFQWEGAVFMQNKPVFATVDACLLNFQDILNQFKLDLDKEYARLVPPMLSVSQRTWYQSFMSSRVVAATWSEFKTAIKARYGVGVLEERQRCASELINAELKLGESVHTFIDRFNDLRRRSLDQIPPSFLLLDRFLLAILPVLKEKINLIRQSKGISNSTDVDIVIDITRELLSSMAANEIEAIMAKTFVPTDAGSAASKWAHVAHSSSSVKSFSGSSSRGVSIASGRVSKPVSKATKSCHFHASKPHNHDTTECKHFRDLLAQQKSGGGANSVPVGVNSNSQQHMMSMREAKSQDRCRKCGAHNFSAGNHECNTAIRTGDAPTSQLHRFRTLRIQDDASAVASSSSPSSAPANVASAGSDSVVVPSLAAGVAKYCMYHQVHSHNTSECKAIARIRPENPFRSSRSVVASNSSRSAALSSSSPSSPSPPVAAVNPVVGEASIPPQNNQSRKGVNESLSSPSVSAAIRIHNCHSI